MTLAAAPHRRTIAHPSAWTVADLGGKDSFAIELGKGHRDRLLAALDRLRQGGTALERIGAADFDLGPMAAEVEGWAQEVLRGRGFVLLRGFPIEDLSEADLERLYWGFGTHFGTGQTQSVLGDLVGHVRDHSAADPDARAYRNRQELSLHTDYTAMIAMLCLTAAPDGGVSRYASAISIHNAMLDERPDLLAPLYEGFHFYRQGEELPGQAPYTEWKVPVFSVKEKQVTIRYIRSFIEAGHELKGEPLTDRQIAALDLLDEIANRPAVRLELLLEPGEMMITNNYTMLHARSAFTDDPAGGRVRHLLRLWLGRPDARPIVDRLDHFGAGGGIPHQADKQPSGEGALLNRIIGREAGPGGAAAS